MWIKQKGKCNSWAVWDSVRYALNGVGFESVEPEPGQYTETGISGRNKSRGSCFVGAGSFGWTLKDVGFLILLIVFLLGAVFLEGRASKR